MRVIDPVTQCEIIKRKPISPMLLTMIMYSNMNNLIDPMPKLPTFKGSYYKVFLTKAERKGLSYEDQQELKRYKWTLEKIYKREEEK